MISDRDDAVDRVITLLRDSMQIDVDGTNVDLIESGVLDSLALVDLIFQDRANVRRLDPIGRGEHRKLPHGARHRGAALGAGRERRALVVTRDPRASRRGSPQVASLVELAFRSGSRTPPPGLAPYLERLLFRHPWVDPEIPSLVSLDDSGQVVGFLGSHIRRFLFDGKPIRLAVSGQLVSDPLVRRQAVGAFLMKRYLEGPQDVTLTDTASETVRRMWEGFGGETVHLGRIGWVRPFSPFRFASVLLLSGRPGLRRAAASFSGPLDSLVMRLAKRHLDTRRPDVSAEPLRPEAMAEALPTVAGDLRLRPDYDTGFLEWLFRELAAVKSRGMLVGFIIRDRSETVLGWYLYYLQPGGVSQVLQIAAKERDVSAVLDHLFHHARTHGSTALRGRLEPSLVETLSSRSCVLHASGYRVLAHAHDGEILHALDSGNAFLSRMDGDWWTGLGLEAFDSDGLTR